MSALRCMNNCRLVARSCFPSLSVVRSLSSGNMGQYHDEKPEMPPWIILPNVDAPMDNPNLLEMLQAEALKFKAGEEDSDEYFERKVEPFLASRCLLVEGKEYSDPWVKRVHLMNRKLLGRFPHYSSKRGLLRRLLTLNEEHRDHLLQMLANSTVLVFKETTRQQTQKTQLPAPIEARHHDHGMQLAPHTGSEDSVTFKIESDASFSEKSRSATIAFLIWRMQRLIECHVNFGLPCKCSGEAEMLGILAALIRGKELCIEKIDIVTDCKVNCDVLAGIIDARSTPYEELCLAVLEVAKGFKALRCRWEPREMLRSVDCVTRLTYPPRLNMGEALRIHTSHYWGLPIFRIDEVKNRAFVEKNFAKNVPDKTITFPKDVYLRAEDFDAKLERLCGFMSVVCPPSVIVLVGSVNEASRLLLALKRYKVAVFDASNNTDAVDSEINAFVLINTSDCPHLSEEKCLLVLLDNPGRPLPSFAMQNPSDKLILRFISKEEDPLGAVKVDPSLYGFFKGYDPYATQDSYAIMTIGIREPNVEPTTLFHVGQLVEQNDPDIICLNGICPTGHLELLKYTWSRDYYASLYYLDASSKNEYTLLLSKLKPSFDRVNISNSDLSIAKIPLTAKNIISVASFENGASITIQAAKETFNALAGCDNVVFVGLGLRKHSLPSGWLDVLDGTQECGMLASSTVCKLTNLKVESANIIGKNIGILVTVSVVKK